MLAAPPQLKISTAPLVGGLVILLLGAIAAALPPSPIATQEGTGGLGTLESPGLFSSGLAEQNAAAGYGYLVLDVSEVRLDQKSLWRSELDLVAQRRFAIWGWIDTKRAKESAAELVSSLNLAGVYVYGEDAGAVAESLRTNARGRPVIAIPTPNAPRPSGVEYGKFVDLDTWLDADEGEFAHPVLMADQLSAADIARAVDYAKKLAGKKGTPKLLVARVPVR